MSSRRRTCPRSGLQHTERVNNAVQSSNTQAIDGEDGNTRVALHQSGECVDDMAGRAVHALGRQQIEREGRVCARASALGSGKGVRRGVCKAESE